MKKQWLVAAVWVVGWVAVRFLRGANFLDSPVLAITTGVFWLLLFTILVFIMLRFGFFALVVAIFVLDSVIGHVSHHRLFGLVRPEFARHRDPDRRHGAVGFPPLAWLTAAVQPCRS